MRLQRSPRCVQRAASVGIVLLVLFPASAHAAGFYTGDVGARAVGRGGAFVAAPDSVLAAHYNPAGLSQLRGLHVLVDASLVDFDATFDRTCPCADPALDEAATYDAALEATFAEAGTQRSRTPLVIPFIGAAYGFEPLDLTVAATLHAPNSGRHQWGDPPTTRTPGYVPQAPYFTGRYAAHTVKNVELNGALSVALQPIPRLRVGASLIVFLAQSEQTQTLWANVKGFPNGPEDPRFDVPIVFTLSPSLFLNWAVGASYEPIDGLFVGASFRAKRKIRGDGTLEAELPRFFRDSATNEPILGAAIRGKDAKIALDIAPIARGGVEYRMPGLFRAEAALVWEGWSAHESIVLTPEDIVIDLMGSSTPIPEIPIDRRWRDTVSVRVGGELEALQPHVGLRAGYYFETSSVDDQRLSLSRIDRPKHGFSIGASKSLFGFTVDVALTYVHFTPVTITNSQVPIVAPFPEEEDGIGSKELVSTIGNGTVESHFLIGSLAVGYTF